MKKLTALALALMLALGLLAGCAGDEPAQGGNEPSQSGDNNNDPAGGEPAENRDDLVIAFNNKIANYDPYSSSLAESYRLNRMLFDTVAEYVGFGGEVELRLAKNYEVSEDGLSWTFELRDDAVFHDGTPVTANDVKVSVEAAMASPYTGSNLTNFESIEVTGERRFVLHTKAYDADTVGQFDQAYIVPDELYTSLGAEGFAEKLIGSGPFALESQDEATGTMVLKANESYWGGVPAIKKIEIRFITDPSTRLIALEKGEVDFLPTCYATDYETLSKNDSLQVSTFPSSNWSFMVLNNRQAPFDNKLVRQAIAYALDYETISVIATGGVGTTVNSLFCKESYGFDTTGVKTYEYNPEKAAELLSQAGVTTPLNLGTVQTPAGQKTTLEYIQQNLAASGINFEIEQVEGSTYVNGLFSGSFTLAYMPSAGLGTVPARAYESLFKTGNPNNFAGYSSAEVDALIDSMHSRKSDDELEKYVQDLLAVVQEEAPIINLHHISSVLAANKNLHVELGGSCDFVFRDFRWN